MLVAVGPGRGSVVGLPLTLLVFVCSAVLALVPARDPLIAGEALVLVLLAGTMLLVVKVDITDRVFHALEKAVKLVCCDKKGEWLCIPPRWMWNNFRHRS